MKSSPFLHQKKNDVFYFRYNNLIIIELQNWQRWLNNNNDKKSRYNDLMRLIDELISNDDKYNTLIDEKEDHRMGE